MTRTGNMALNFKMLKRLFPLLWIITLHADCASLQKCVQCSLSFNRAPELNNHDSVIVYITHPLQEVPQQVYSVSSLCDEARCSVRGCFHKSTQYNLQVYPNDTNTVLEKLVNEPDLLPDCGQEGISERKNPDGANGNFSNMFLIWFTVCWWTVFHLAI